MAKKNKGGAKLKFQTLEEMQDAIDRYFTDCAGKPLLDSEGGIVYNVKTGEPFIVGAKPPTVTGLALALGFSSRQSLVNYQARKAFVDTVTRAKARCEEYAEARLFDRDGQRGAEFSLRCNFKWRDKEAEEQADAEVANRALLSLAALINRPSPNRVISDE